MARREVSPYQMPLLFRPEAWPELEVAQPTADYQIDDSPLGDGEDSGQTIRFLREVSEPVQVRMVADAARFLMMHIYQPWDAFTQEELVGLVLNNQNVITHTYMVYRGTIDSVRVRVAEVFRPAIHVNASALILSHNHPSDVNAKPSPEDVRVTNNLVDAGSLLEIPVLDHVVVSKDTYVSMKEAGLGFK